LGHCHPDYSDVRRKQGARPRVCLLKGCGRSFDPPDPLSRYCGPECGEAARRWSLARADRRYRASPHGRERRREQASRRRGRQREERARRGPADDASAMAPAAMAPAATAEAEVPAPPAEAGRVGDQQPEIPGEICARPGCYETFAPSRRSPARRFCDCLCRKALRRVLRRERLWRARLLARGGRDAAAPIPRAKYCGGRDPP